MRTIRLIIVMVTSSLLFNNRTRKLCLLNRVESCGKSGTTAALLCRVVWRKLAVVRLRAASIQICVFVQRLQDRHHHWAVLTFEENTALRCRWRLLGPAVPHLYAACHA